MEALDNEALGIVDDEPTQLEALGIVDDDSPEPCVDLSPVDELDVAEPEEAVTEVEQLAPEEEPVEAVAEEPVDETAQPVIEDHATENNDVAEAIETANVVVESGLDNEVEDDTLPDVADVIEVDKDVEPRAETPPQLDLSEISARSAPDGQEITSKFTEQVSTPGLKDPIKLDSPLIENPNVHRWIDEAEVDTKSEKIEENDELTASLVEEEKFDDFEDEKESKKSDDSSVKVIENPMAAYIYETIQNESDDSLMTGSADTFPTETETEPMLPNVLESEKIQPIVEDEMVESAVFEEKTPAEADIELADKVDNVVELDESVEVEPVEDEPVEVEPVEVEEEQEEAQVKEDTFRLNDFEPSRPVLVSETTQSMGGVTPEVILEPHIAQTPHLDHALESEVIDAEEIKNIVNEVDELVNQITSVSDNIEIISDEVQTFTDVIDDIGTSIKKSLSGDNIEASSRSESPATEGMISC